MEQAERLHAMGTTTSAARIRSPAHAFFAVTMIAIGIVGLTKGAFTPTWSGVPQGFPARVALAYLCACVCLASGLGLLWHRTAAIASRILLGSFLVWMVLFRVPGIIRTPVATDPWWAAGDTAVMAAAAWVLYVWIAGAGDRGRLRFATGENGLRIAHVLFGLGLIPFGVAHFTYFQHTVNMVPGWLPWHVGVASATGGAFIVAGAAVIVGAYARLAAALVTLQLALFTLLVWVRVIVAHPSPSDRAEFISSWVLTAAAWVVADSYRRGVRA
jgi:uncharacterized membrane protein